MIYKIKSHPTKYAGTVFRSRLEARWAAFFDLAGWAWEYEPIDLVGWTPDFRVVFPCRHTQCNGEHSLLVEVKPYYTIEEFKDHPCVRYSLGEDEKGNNIPACSSAAFGVNPSVSYFDMAHGDGVGVYNIHFWVKEADYLWAQAGNITRYKAPIVSL